MRLVTQCRIEANSSYNCTGIPYEPNLKNVTRNDIGSNRRNLDEKSKLSNSVNPSPLTFRRNSATPVSFPLWFREGAIHCEMPVVEAINFSSLSLSDTGNCSKFCEGVIRGG